MIINTNVMALGAHRNIKSLGKDIQKASTRLSGGRKINSGADDAAGMAISEKMKAQIRGVRQAERNVEDGISLIQTMDGGMDGIQEMMIRQRELIIQGLNDTNTDEDREKIQKEIDQLTAEIGDCADRVEFNKIPLLNVPDLGAGGAIVEYGRDVIRASWETVMTVPGGTNARIQSLYNEFTALTPPYNIADIHDIAGRLSTEVAKGNKAFVDIIETVNDIIADLGDDAFDAGKLAVYRSQVRGHYDDKAHYEGSYLNPATTGTADALRESDSIAARASLETAFLGIANDHPHGGAWGMGSGMVACHRPVSDAAWALLEDVNVTSGISPNAIHIQCGANSGQGMYIDRYDCRPASLGIDELVIKPLEAAEQSLKDLDEAFGKVNGYRARAGAQQNRLEHTDNSLAIAYTSLEDANSRIADADMAKEMMNLTKANILNSAGVSMLAQANNSPQTVLQLLR